MKKKEICTVIRQKEIGDGIFSMWIQTENIGKEAKPGQFVSLYSKDGSKLLPRPISLCEIDRENSRLRLVYRVTGAKTGTEEFSRLKAGDTIPVIGPLDVACATPEPASPEASIEIEPASANATRRLTQPQREYTRINCSVR